MRSKKNWILGLDTLDETSKLGLSTTPEPPTMTDEARARRNLIAAAPDLLEACQWALNTLRDSVSCPDGCPEELESALVAAIAKAEGR